MHFKMYHSNTRIWIFGYKLVYIHLGLVWFPKLYMRKFHLLFWRFCALPRMKHVGQLSVHYACDSKNISTLTTQYHLYIHGLSPHVVGYAYLPILHEIENSNSSSFRAFTATQIWSAKNSIFGLEVEPEIDRYRVRIPFLRSLYFVNFSFLTSLQRPREAFL